MRVTSILITCLMVCSAIAVAGGLQAQNITTIAGTGVKGYSGDGGPAAQAGLNQPFDVAIDKQGNLYFSDTFNHCVRRIDAKSGRITTVAGCGRKGYSGDGGPAVEATLNEPYGVELDDERNLYIVDRLNYCVRRVDAKSGTIETIAGTGQSGYSGDGGPGKQAQLREPNGIALSSAGQAGGVLCIADVRDQRVRLLNLRTGVIDTFCGTGRKEHTGDAGPASSASLLGPRAVAFDDRGNLYVCEREGNRIRKIDHKAGIITTIAGTGAKGNSGDGGPAVEATFNGPKEIDVDTAGNIFVVDTENHAIRKIDARTGLVTTVAGDGRHGGGGDRGPATAASLDRPHGVVVDRFGAIYIADTNNHRIRRVPRP